MNTQKPVKIAKNTGNVTLLHCVLEVANERAGEEPISRASSAQVKLNASSLHGHRVLFTFGQAAEPLQAECFKLIPGRGALDCPAENAGVSSYELPVIVAGTYRIAETRHNTFQLTEHARLRVEEAGVTRNWAASELDIIK
jgi:hypothetical protein